ncbi:MAG: translational GTPase TypA [Planctomycetota bacterium]
MPHQKRRKDVRNIAIIAHVDHGKTTLVDALLKQTGAYTFKAGESTIMDSNPIERERGITIFSKNASFIYKGVQVNLVDTPGHADFGSEVERILKMVDGALLLVDALDGPMPQTKYVLKKSLELHLKPIVVVNKIDRPNARAHAVADMTFDLFCELNATDEQLDFPIVYASGRDGVATMDMDEPAVDMKPLLDTILHRVLPPVADPEQPFQLLATMLEYDNHLGSIATGRILHGMVRAGETIALVKAGDTVVRGTVSTIMRYQGLKRGAVPSAEAGDIVSIAGLDGVEVGDTLAGAVNPVALPRIKVDEPTVAMVFGANTSPLTGRDGGRFLTARHIRERLERERLNNVGVRIEKLAGSDRMKVAGRGELTLSILIETMRREGYELEVSAPHVIMIEEGGQTLEPFEELLVDVDQGYEGNVIQALGQRRGEMKDMQVTSTGAVRMNYVIPTRGLMGFRSDLLQMTRGTGVMCQNFHGYKPFKGEIPHRQVGVQVSMNAGKAVAYALWSLQERGDLFAAPGTEVYEGMIIGVNNKGRDMVVNALRGKKLTAIRSTGADEAIDLVPLREMTLEFALEFIEDDELVEVTPKHIRLRKQLLTENERRHEKRANA